jgi:hypothetical protein
MAKADDTEVPCIKCGGIDLRRDLLPLAHAPLDGDDDIGIQAWVHRQCYVAYFNVMMPLLGMELEALAERRRAELNAKRAPSDERMAKLRAAIHASRDGDLTALTNCEVTPSELISVAALAKAGGDQFMHNMALALHESMFNRKLP